jgi:hypothetical protein
MEIWPGMQPVGVASDERDRDLGGITIALSNPVGPS